MALVLGMLVTVAPGQASAASPILNPHPTCSGSLVGNHDWSVGSTKMGTLYVYYSSASGGTNCLWFQKSFHRGSATYTYVDVGVCTTTSPDSCSRKDEDGGAFQWYAGPVRTSGTAGKCIDSIVEIENYVHRFPPFHCG